MSVLIAQEALIATATASTAIVDATTDIAGSVYLNFGDVLMTRAFLTFFLNKRKTQPKLVNVNAFYDLVGLT